METLDLIPTIIANGWMGYQHFMDQTVLPFNVLTYPSTNCTIPSIDKVVPDKGKTLIGQAYTQNVGIIGNKEKFTTMGGIDLEVRVYASQQYLDFTGLVGDFGIGETITGSMSGATATVISKDTGRLIISSVAGGPFTVGETITGSTSGATATVSVEHTTFNDTIEVLYTDTNPSGAFYNEPHWYQITENVNPLAQGLHRYSFDQWFDSNLDPALSLNLPRLIWVNGLPNVFSWTGGIAPIVSLVVNTSITTTSGVSWASLGFVDPALGGSGNIIINGVSYTITGGWSTDTLTLADTTGISAGDLAFAQIESDSAPIGFDFCKQCKNYMFYGNWTARQLYMSNAFSKDASQDITAVQAVQNDLVLAQSPLYNGTGSHVYRVTIDSVNPNVNEQEFIAGGGGALDDGIYDTSGYSGTAGDTNVYNILMVGDTDVVASAITSGTFAVGDYVVGSVTKAVGIIVYMVALGSGAYDFGINMVTKDNSYDKTNDTLTDYNTGGTIAPADFSSVISQNFFQFIKNGAIVNTNTGAGSFPVSKLINSSITLTDGLTALFSSPSGHAVGDSFKLTINQGGADTYQWQIDGAAPVATNVAIVAGVQQLLNDDIYISFTSQTGHAVGDFWDITVNQEITEAWHNFYFTLPSRKPGEGYIFRLPSNFWTMDTQEEKLYVNTQYGEWSTIGFTLSQDLLNETVDFSPLKQSGALKAIDPWMTGHLEDDLIFVTLDKALMSMGRKEFLQEPQDGYISDAVKLDFQASSFTGGGIKYIGKRLYISSPEEGITHCYDVAKKYWQPPKTFPEMGMPTVIGNQLAFHSNTRNQTFLMFTGSTDNGQAYTVEVRTPSTAFYKMINRKRFPARWYQKFSSCTFIEGYMKGACPLVFNVYLGVNGCGGVYDHEVAPTYCIPPDRAPFGEGSLGSHPFGSDVAEPPMPYFNEAWPKFSPILKYYFIAFGITCTSKSQTWEILQLGINMGWALYNNKNFIPPEAEE